MWLWKEEYGCTHRWLAWTNLSGIKYYFKIFFKDRKLHLWEHIDGNPQWLFHILEVNGIIVGLMRQKSIGSFSIVSYLKVSVLPYNSLYWIDLNLIYYIAMQWTNHPDLSRNSTELQIGIIIFNQEWRYGCLCAILMAVFWQKLELIIFFGNSTGYSMLDDPPAR